MFLKGCAAGVSLKTRDKVAQEIELQVVMRTW